MKNRNVKKISIIFIIAAISAVTILVVNNLDNKNSSQYANEPSYMTIYDKVSKELIIFKDGEKEQVLAMLEVLPKTTIYPNETIVIKTDDKKYYIYHAGTLNGPVQGKRAVDSQRWEEVVSGNGQYIAYVKDNKLHLYDGYSGEDKIIDDTENMEWEEIIISPDGSKVFAYGSLLLKKNYYRGVYNIYYDGQKKEVRYPNFVLNDGSTLSITNMLLQRHLDGTEKELATDVDNDRGGVTINATCTQMVFPLKTATGERGTILIDNGKTIELSDKVGLNYAGKYECIRNLEYTIHNMFSQIYASSYDDLLDACYADSQGCLYYVDEKGRVEQVTDFRVNDFVALERYIYVLVDDFKLYVYDKKTDKLSEMPILVETIVPYLYDDGVLMIARVGDTIGLWYCSDGKNTELLMEGVSSVAVSGEYIYPMVKVDDYTGKYYVGTLDTEFKVVVEKGNRYFYKKMSE